MTLQSRCGFVRVDRVCAISFPGVHKSRPNLGNCFCSIVLLIVLVYHVVLIRVFLPFCLFLLLSVSQLVM